MEDFNEVHYHLLESLYISLTLRNPSKVSFKRLASPTRSKSQPLWLAILNSPRAGLQEVLLLELEILMPTTCREVPMRRMTAVINGPTSPVSIEPS